MLGKKSHPPIIVLAAAGSGGPLLVHALSSHSNLHGFDDGGVWADLLRLVDALAEESADQREARIERVLAAAAQSDGAVNELDDRGIESVWRKERVKILHAFARRNAEARDSIATRAAARRAAEQLASKVAERAGKQGFAVHAVDCAGRAAAIAELFPEALIVHLIRDGRAIALTRAGAAARPGGLRPWAQAWLGEVAQLLAFEAVNPERVVKVAYEDLLTAPHVELEKLCVSAGVASEPEPMATALRAAYRDSDEFAFRSDLLDTWQIVELESALQPVLSLLGYRPASDFETLSRLRAEAQAYEASRTEAIALRAKLDAYEGLAGVGRGDKPSSAATEFHGDQEDFHAIAQELVSLRQEVVSLRQDAQRNEGVLDELRQLRFRVRDQQDLPVDFRTLRWKAKRYDQIRAAASPILRIKRLRARP